MGNFIGAGTTGVTSACDLQRRDIAFCRRQRAATEHVVRLLRMRIPGTHQKRATRDVLVTASYLNACSVLCPRTFDGIMQDGSAPWAETARSNTIASIGRAAVSIALMASYIASQPSSASWEGDMNNSASTTNAPRILITKSDRQQLDQLLSDHAPIRSWRAVELLVRELLRANIVEDDLIPDNVVTMRSQVSFREDGNERIKTVTLAYPGESSMYDDAASVVTLVGASLLGLSEGQSISYPRPNAGMGTITVVKVIYQPEAARRRSSSLVGSWPRNEMARGFQMGVSNLPEIVVTKADFDRLNNMFRYYAPILSWEVVRVLRGEIDRARVVDIDSVPPSAVTMNSQVKIRDRHSGHTRLATLTYPAEQNAHFDAVSVLTPLGTALLGLSKSQSIGYVDSDGRETAVEVLEVLFQPEAQSRLRGSQAKRSPDAM
jgi:regulator of nucleoside diphosphate kinase